MRQLCLRHRVKVLYLITLSLILASTSVAQNLDSIRMHLESAYRTSLSLRQTVMPTVKKFGFQSKEMDSLNVLILHSDSVAVKSVVGIIDKYGWLGKSKVGFVANQALFITIQHADKTYREKYYPLLEASASIGESNLFDMATMKDRLLVENGMEQIYGTQTDHEGRYFPIGNIKQVNKRRKKVGLKRIKIKDDDVKKVQHLLKS